MGELMTKNVTVVRNNDALAETLIKLENIDERLSHIGVQDKATWGNANAPFIRQLHGMVDLAKVITKGALERSRSPEATSGQIPRSNSDNQMAKPPSLITIPYTCPVLSYKEVDTSLIAPRKRDYTKAH